MLEELCELPVMSTASLNAEQLSQVKGVTPPLTSHQVEASLSHEFNRHIVATDWSEYTDLRSSWQQAARLLHRTLASMPEMEDASEWLKEEATLLEREIQTGDYGRWVNLLDNRELTEEQRQAAGPAARLLARNPHLHPTIKQQVMDKILSILTTTIK